MPGTGLKLKLYLVIRLHADNACYILIGAVHGLHQKRAQAYVVQY